MRITFNTTGITNPAQALLLTTTQRNLLTTNVLPDAKAFLQSLLQVDPVVGNLFASRRCISIYSNGVCAAYSTSLPTCGSSPSVTIPQSYVSAGYHSCTSSSNVREAWAA